MFGITFNSIYAIIILLPTIVLNSAFWGQCDSMYVFCIILAMILIFKDKYLPAFLLIGISFALKLQTVFILPFLVSYYFVKKRFSVVMFFVSLLSFWLCGGIAYIFGRDPLDEFKIYISQSSFYPHMWLDARSFWRLFGDDYQRFSGFAVLLTLSICGIGFYMIIQKKKRMDTMVQILNTATWFTWVCFFFLPAMHDRYAYLTDILLIILAFLDKRYIKFAVFSALLSFMTYPAFLIWMNGVTREDAFIEFFVFIYFTYMIMKPEENLESLKQ
jgi:Gpi18-like mannosyltransferase